MSHPQCVGLAREVVLWHGFDHQSWVVLAEAPLPASARRCDWDNRPPEVYFGRADVPSAVRWSGEGSGVIITCGAPTIKTSALDPDESATPETPSGC